MKFSTIVVLTSIFVFTITGAGFAKKVHLFNCEEKVGKAIEKYNQKKYSDAGVILEEVKTNCSGASMIDTVLYYLGMSYVHTKKFVEARSEFERLSRDFPSSIYAEEASFRIGYAVLMQSNPPDRDQSDTKEAIRLIRDFLESHPEGAFADSANHYLRVGLDKLAEKEFLNARFYERLGEKDAALVYYRSLIGDYTDSKFADQGRLNSVELLVDLQRYDEAQQVLDDINTNVKDQEILKKAHAVQVKLKGK